WYQEHLNAPVFAGRTSRTPLTAATCKVERGADRSWPALDREGMFRSPSAAVVFGDVALPWYMRQGDRPLASSRGHVYDHVALVGADAERDPIVGHRRDHAGRDGRLPPEEFAAPHDDASDPARRGVEVHRLHLTDSLPRVVVHGRPGGDGRLRPLLRRVRVGDV